MKSVRAYRPRDGPLNAMSSQTSSVSGMDSHLSFQIPPAKGVGIRPTSPPPSLHQFAGPINTGMQLVLSNLISWAAHDAVLGDTDGATTLKSTSFSFHLDCPSGLRFPSLSSCNFSKIILSMSSLQTTRKIVILFKRALSAYS